MPGINSRAMNVKVQRTYDIILILFFLGAISLPLVKGVITPDEKQSVHEKRVLAEFPPFPTRLQETVSFVRGFEKYFNDHFGYREEMVRRYHREMERRFNVTGNPLVIKGEEGWYFYTANNLLDDFQGRMVLSREDFNHWYDEQVWRYNWLQQRGIEYLTFSPPNKQTIYPEKMPKVLRDAAGDSLRVQLEEYLEKRPLPFYVDITREMREAGEHHKLYFAMDSHWNFMGAYVGYKKVMSAIQSRFPKMQSPADFVFFREYQQVSGGDLAQMLLVDEKVVEMVPMVRPWRSCSSEAPLTVELSDVSTNEFEKPLLQQCPQRKLKAVVFCDSYITHLKPFLSENFSQVLYLQKGFDHNNIEELLPVFKPDIVLEERVERNFFRKFTVSDR